MSDQVKYAPSLAAALAIMRETVEMIRAAQVSDPEAGADLLDEIETLTREVVEIMGNESPDDSDARQAVLIKARDLIDRLRSADAI